MQEQEISKLLEELGLDSQDAKLRELIQKILDTRPYSQLSPSFKQRLRQELSSRIALGSAAESINGATQKQPQAQTINYFTIIMQKFMVPALVAVLVLVAGGVWYTNQNPGLINLGGDGQLLSGRYSVDELGANSFGDLSKVAIVGGGANTGGGRGGDSMQLTERTVHGSEPGSGGSDASILPFPEGYRFVYEGAEISELAEVHNVLKRQKPVQTESVVSRIIRIFSFGLIDLTRFNNTRIQNFAFIEDKEYGLGVNVDLNYGNVNIYQNWEKWPQLGYGCEGLLDEQVFMELERRGQAENGSYEYCGVLPRISEGDIPSDDEAIAIARQFVSDYGVSMEGYGEPRVYEYYPWRIAYEQATNKTSFYFPENVQVLFPLVLEGQSVYDEGGHPTGMTVNIDVRTRLVNGMYGLETKQFQRSEYKGETDANRLLQIAERGGYRNGFWDGGSNIATLRLDTPTIEMVRIWYSVDPMNQGEELLVPSLVFPIKNATENNYWRKTIIVPLVRDLLDNENQGWGPIMPMPAPDPRPVEPDGGIGDTPVSTEPSEPQILPFPRG